ncbi:MAG: HDOD domain-containing protein [bacterium]
MPEDCTPEQLTADRLIDRLGDLPAAPVVLSKALRLTSNLQSNTKDLVRSLSADQSLSAKVVRLSNSPLYARMRAVLSLDEAIRVLGFSQLKSIIITASTFRMFEKCEHAQIATDLWHHSLSTAIGARLVARKSGQVDKEEAYLAGLLHDIGKLVLLKLAPNAYEDIIEKVKSTEQPFMSVEFHELGFSHIDVGESLLTKWQFPSQIIAGVADHHRVILSQRPSSLQLSRIVRLADSISRYIGTSFYEPYKNDLENTVYVGPKELTVDELISLRCEAESQYLDELNHVHQ